MTFSANASGQPQNSKVEIHHADCPQSNNNCSCCQLTKCYEYKYLGIIIDQHLRWDRHTQTTAKRLRRTLYKFRLLRNKLNTITLRQVYHAIVQSIVQYCVLIWGGAYAVHLNSVECAQRCVLRVALKKHYLYPSAKLYTDMNVPTLTNLYARQLIQYRIKNRPNLTTQSYYGTRHAQMGGLNFIPCRTSLFRRSYIYRSISLYNLFKKQCSVNLAGLSAKKRKTIIANFTISNSTVQ